ncbi:MAG: recombinase family protein [Mobilitalea sp.]
MMQRHMPMGYKMVNGEITIREEQAKIVRNIFADYIAGKSMLAIAKELTVSGVLNTNKKPNWNHGSVGKILQNVKYQGDEIFPRLIDLETFKKTQERRADKEKELGRTQQFNTIKNRNIFCRKVRCGECGVVYKKYAEHAGRPSEKIKWKCKNYISLNRVLCKNLFFTEDELKNIFIEATNQLIKQKWMLEKEQPKEQPRISLELRQIENRIKELEQDGQFSFPELAELIFKRAEFYYAGSKIDDYKSNTERIKKALEGINLLTEFDEKLFGTIIKYITVYRNFYIEMEFMNGIVIRTNLEYKRGDGNDGSSEKDGINRTGSNTI